MNTQKQNKRRIDSNDIDVQDFKKKYLCHPLEAEAFYPDQFTVHTAGDWESWKKRKK